MKLADVMYRCRLSLNRCISLRGWLVHVAVVSCVYTVSVGQLEFDIASAHIFSFFFYDIHRILPIIVASSIPSWLLNLNSRSTGTIPTV